MAPSYHITVHDTSTDQWSAWCDRLTMTSQPTGPHCGPTRIKPRGRALLIKRRDLGVPLRAVQAMVGTAGMGATGPVAEAHARASVCQCVPLRVPRVPAATVAGVVYYSC